MPIRTLSSHTALVPGADLWIISDLHSSDWTQRLDWYLNFQITKAKSHQTPGLSDEQIDSLKEWELPIYEKGLRQNDVPLMISTEELLPNRQTVILPYNGDITAWLSEAEEIWKSLKKPSVRFFLPDGISKAETVRQWQIPETADISVVETGLGR